MGIYGFAEWSYIDFFSTFSLINISTNNVYHGINWIYTFAESALAYDFNITYSWFTNNIYSDNFDFNYYAYWYVGLDISYFTLFWSVILDKIVLSHLIQLPYLSDWFKFLNNSYEGSILFINHPEYVFISDYIIKTLIMPFSSEIDFLIYSMIDEENYLSPMVIIPNIIIIALFILFFITLYFSYYNSSVREENTIDHDFLSANTTVEAEEEIGSFEDMFLATLIISYIFLWYFYINCWSIISAMPEFFFTIYLFPFLYYIIMCIPAFLAFDFGLYFTAYLRGVGASPMMIVELLYDYIAFSAFYIRLIVQNVRLILMTFTFASFHEIIIFHGIDKDLIFGNENFWDDISKSIRTPSGITYFLVFKLSGHIIYFFYELFHTLFVVTAQFIAFFAMVFWLFLFLYTMFSSELHEKYFNLKRATKKQFYSRFFNLKLKILNIK